MNSLKHLLTCGLLAACAAANAAEPTNDDAAAFGAMETVYDVALNADGTKLVYVGGGTGSTTMAVIRFCP